MDVQDLLQQLREGANGIHFEDVMETIDRHYCYTPQRFVNGPFINEAGSNEGACRVFAFARLHQLTDEQTLACFGRFYRDVRDAPDGQDHVNIRQFMRTGLSAVSFDGPVLEKK